MVGFGRAAAGRVAGPAACHPESPQLQGGRDLRPTACTYDRKAGLTVTGETTVRWVGEGDTLLVDGLLVEPVRRAVELPGALAW